jgi:uncharacterized membrane protein HdeD (DUF308 family)
MVEGTSTTPAEHDVADALRQHSTWFIALGVLWIVLGSLAILLPWIASLTVELMFGLIFLVGGAAQVAHAFRARGWSGFLGHALAGMLALLLGLMLLFFPVQGVLSLTILLAAFFIAQGALQVFVAFRSGRMRNRGWLIASGALGVVIGLVIWFGWPGSAAWALGVLVGVQLIFTGWALVMAAVGARRGIEV